MAEERAQTKLERLEDIESAGLIVAGRILTGIAESLKDDQGNKIKQDPYRLQALAAATSQVISFSRVASGKPVNPDSKKEIEDFKNTLKELEGKISPDDMNKAAEIYIRIERQNKKTGVIDVSQSNEEDAIYVAKE